MISEGIDLGYQGVLGIWKGIEELNKQKCTMTGELISDNWLSQAVKSIVSSKGKKTSGITIPHDSEKSTKKVMSNSMWLVFHRF